MLNNPLLEMAISRLDEAKQTPNKLRWDTKVEGTLFSLYIPKWRVPEPWPSSIWVKVIPRRREAGDPPNLSRNDVESDPILRQEPIVATVLWNSPHSRTDRYSPLGLEETWEIGEPYIPHSLTYGGTQRLRVIILWDITTLGHFQS